jgi:DnaJ-domain-containing protein 1
MDNLEKFRNLLIMAAADQRMTESELRLLSDRATEWGITDDQFESAIERAVSGTADLTVPSNRDGMRDLLTEMIHMMAADGRISSPEKRLFAVVAAAVGMSTVELDRLIDDVVRES